MNDFKILLESELLIRDGEIVGTHKPTSHYLVLNVRMELLSPSIKYSKSDVLFLFF